MTEEHKYGSIAEELLETIRHRFSSEETLDDEMAADIIVETVFNDCRTINMSFDAIEHLIYKFFCKTRKKLGILEPLVLDNDINEIMVNGKDKIFYEKDGKIEQYNLTFDSVEELEEVMRNIVSEVHREFNELNPIVDARLKDGSRVNCVFKNVAVNGPILTIRKFPESHITMDDLIGNNTVTEEQAVFLKVLVRCGYNIFVSGGTSSGKTTMLNALSEAIPEGERVIVIEDSMELKLNMINNIVRMECRNANSQGKGKVTMADLIRSSLRMRPTRIIVGEVRGGEVVEMISAMNTGHDGSLSTGHANSVSGMLKRLESMYLMAVSLDIEAIRNQIAEGIDIMIHLERREDGSRCITEIKELIDYRDGKFVLNDLLSESSTGLINLRKAETAGEEYIEILSRGPGCGHRNGETVL